MGESGAALYSVCDMKQQNDRELWYMIDGSFITHLPDVWGLNQKYILLSVNKWDDPYHKVNIGGLTCDSQDYYNSEAHTGEVFLPMKSCPSRRSPTDFPASPSLLSQSATTLGVASRRAEGGSGGNQCLHASALASSPRCWFL